MFYRVGRKPEKPQGGATIPAPFFVRLRVKTQYVEVTVTQINRVCNQMLYGWYKILVGKAQSGIPRPPAPSFNLVLDLQLGFLG